MSPRRTSARRSATWRMPWLAPRAPPDGGLPAARLRRRKPSGAQRRLRRLRQLEARTPRAPAPRSRRRDPPGAALPVSRGRYCGALDGRPDRTRALRPGGPGGDLRCLFGRTERGTRGVPHPRRAHLHLSILLLYLALGVAVPAAVIAGRGESKGGTGSLRTSEPDATRRSRARNSSSRTARAATRSMRSRRTASPARTSTTWPPSTSSAS